MRRCAIYARYSSDMQRAESIDDQLSECRKHIRSNGWTVMENHIYTDYAVSGSDVGRAGYLAMKKSNSALAKPNMSTHQLKKIAAPATIRTGSARLREADQTIRI